MLVDNGGTILNGLLRSKDYKARRVTRCVEGLSTATHSANSILAKNRISSTRNHRLVSKINFSGNFLEAIGTTVELISEEILVALTVI
ncbi:hypothetical protein TNCV_2128511 [Trichonephila clavipes]|nr:hypothetical protein TNCV_2128511 [Trichonephila clavipes]